MAWTDILDSLFSVNKPARATDMKALRDNIPALAAGVAGAPKIETAALNDLGVTTAKIAAAAVTSAKLATGAPEDSWVLARLAGASLPITSIQPPTAGSTYQLWRAIAADTAQSTTNTGWGDSLFVSSSNVELAVTCVLAGVVTFNAELYSGGTGIYTYVRIIKNGVLVATFSRNAASWANLTQNITVAAGDRLKFTIYTSNGSFAASWRNVRITSGTPSLGIG